MNKKYLVILTFFLLIFSLGKIFSQEQQEEQPVEAKEEEEEAVVEEEKSDNDVDAQLEEMDEELEDESPLHKALLQHFEIIGKDRSEKELLETFKEVFKLEQETEIFGGALMPQELMLLKNNMLFSLNYDHEILQAIRELKRKK